MIALSPPRVPAYTTRRNMNRIKCTLLLLLTIATSSGADAPHVLFQSIEESRPVEHVVPTSKVMAQNGCGILDRKVELERLVDVARTHLIRTRGITMKLDIVSITHVRHRALVRDDAAPAASRLIDMWFLDFRFVGEAVNLSDGAVHFFDVVMLNDGTIAELRPQGTP